MNDYEWKYYTNNCLGEKAKYHYVSSECFPMPG